LKRIGLTRILIFFLALFSFVSEGHTENLENEKTGSNYPWAVSLYGGITAGNSDTLSDIFTFDASYSDDDKLVVAALSREIYRYEQYLSLELEGQVGRHFGDDSFWEFAGLGMVRWLPFPWDDDVDTSLDIGAGFSYYTEISEMEKERDEDAQRLLGYLAFELTFGLPQYPRWDLMLRLHHRSGLQEVIGDSESNFLCVGIKYAF
jgi:hypothetical protein